MKKKHSFKSCLQLFLSFMKIGALTFGGGYAMIPIIQKEACEKRKWISDEEILDIIAISESTPGPIAVNSATYVGFHVAGFWGSFCATIGLVVPSFAIIFLISIFYKTFMQIEVFQAAFKGIRVGVITLLALAFLKLKKNVPTNTMTIILFSLAFSATVALNFLSITIPGITIIFIACGAITGLVLTLINSKKRRKQQ